MIKTYLEKLQAPDESFFPMDSIHTGKPVDPKVIYGEDVEVKRKKKKKLK